MADAGVPENFIPKVLNHVEAGVTRRHYNLHAYRGEKRAALETWARYLEAILANKQPATATVVPFRRFGLFGFPNCLADLLREVQHQATGLEDSPCKKTGAVDLLEVHFANRRFGKINRATRTQL